MSRKEQRLEKALQSDVIEIKAVTWNKDSHGLFDYQSKNCANHKFKFKAADISIFRNKQTPEIISVPTDDARQRQLHHDYSLLTNIFSKKENGQTKYYIGSAPKVQNTKAEEQMQTEESLTDQVVKDDIYLIVRSLKNPDKSNKGHALQIGQKIKLGRIQYSVIQMKIGQKMEMSQGSRFSFLKNQTRHEDMDLEIQPGATCKICMEDYADSSNFLLSPCKCSGSCKYIHLNCLKNWMISKIKKDVVGGTAYYHFDKFQCQICQWFLPKFVIRNGIQYQLLNVDRPEGNYLILQQNGENKKDVIVIKNIPQQGINLGRGHQCEIRINDISVSRQHAMIVLKQGRFMLFDKVSKFGTLVKLTKNLAIDDTRRAFQIGRTVLTFMMKKERMDSKDMSPILIQDEKPERRASK